MALMHAPAEVLKAKLNLTHAQVAKIQPIRTNFQSKRIKLHADVQQIRLKQWEQMQVDLPDETKVLDLMRKARAIQGQIMEERVKAHLGILRVLTKEQRTQVRSQCPFGGPGSGPGPGPGGPGGKGWGRGHGGGGWGGGGGGEGRWKGFNSIRINDQWRVVFRWERSTAHEVAVVDYP